MAVSLADSSDSAPYQVRLVRKVRKLPLPGVVLVRVGDIVRPDTPVARIALRPGIPWVIPGARLLGIDTDRLSSSMRVGVGDRVKTQQVIAQADRGLYGRKELVSPTDGVIEDISDRSGRITIREEFGKEDPPVVVNVADQLQCRPEELPRHMIRQAGQEVKKGQIIAKKGETQAFFTKSAEAPVSGVISAIDGRSGKVTIARPFKQVVVNAYIDGRVAEVIESRGCIVEVPGVKLSGVFGVGRETNGEIRVLTSGPDQVLTPEMIPPDCNGKVVVGGAFTTDEALAKAAEVGVKGIITGTVNYLNLTESLGIRLGVGITGQEDIDLAVILTEGFGHLAMRGEVWRALKALEGRRASMNGATQIRAGAVRPEVIVPFPDYSGPLFDEAAADEDLKTGMRVRIINEPYFGVLGEIVEIERHARVIETEARVPTVKVRCDDGRMALVARQNIEGSRP